MVIAMIMSLMWIGCSDDTDSQGDGNFQPAPANTSTNNTDPSPNADAGFDTGESDADEPDGDAGLDDADAAADSGDVTSPPDDVAVSEDASSSDNTDPGEPAPQPCEIGKDLGALEEGSHEVTLEFGVPDGPFSAQCEHDGSGEMAVAAFSLKAVGDLSIVVDDAENTGLELRNLGVCPGSTLLGCEDEELSFDGLPWNNEMFLMIHRLPGHAQDTVDVTFDVSPHELCESLGDRRCVDDEFIERCQHTQISPDEPVWIDHRCPAGCNDDRCIGDRCSDPIVVTASIDIEGSITGMHDYHQWSDQPDCGLEDDAEAIGKDLVFRLADLKAGDQVDVEIDYPVDNDDAAIFIKESCDDSASCEALWEGETTIGFSPPHDGDFYLVVDATERYVGSVGISIDIQ